MEGSAFCKKGLIARIKAWFRIVEQAHQNVQKTSLTSRTAGCTRLISWIPPDEGWIQLQTDGSVVTSTGKAAAGGLFRNNLGQCKGAFVCNLGSCSITAAELKGALEGLKIAWQRGYRRIQLNLDSLTALEIIKQRQNDNHRHGSLAKQFSYLLNLDWEVTVSHVYREANCAADFLANKAHDFDFGTHPFNVCDVDLVQWLRHDVMGISHERFTTNVI
ncbi:unnamed protein product [Linum trigynum]|uniref:RNase H type-1 domain-containing protein n=1 Tax=Linum trigynum TaxID=586398 RepID=A0AAV2EFY8_9ROSI